MWGTIRNCAVIIAAYYLLPLRADPASWVTWLRGLLFVAGIAFVVVAVGREVRRQLAAEPPVLELGTLIQLATLGITLFAYADYAIADRWTGEFTGLTTRTDALYFTLSTLATVGFGDIHAQGQLARALLIAQMAFNLLVLATTFSILTSRLRNRARSHPD